MCKRAIFYKYVLVLYTAMLHYPQRCHSWIIHRCQNLWIMEPMGSVPSECDRNCALIISEEYSEDLEGHVQLLKTIGSDSTDTSN